MSTPVLRVQRLRPEAVLPTRGSKFAIGYDLYAVEKTLLPVGGRAAIHTGIAVAVPHLHYGRIAPRSGLAKNHGIDIYGGVIDADFRGEILVLMQNSGGKSLWVEPGMKVAQLVLERASILELVEVGSLDETERGAAGFGSTGLY